MADQDSNKFAKRYARFIMRVRYPLLAIIILSTLLAAFYIKDIDLRNDPDTLLPGTNHHVLTNAYVEKIFGMGNLMVIGLEVKEGDIYQPWFVNTVRRVHQRIEALPSARPGNFISIAAKKVRYIWGTEDGLDIRRLIPRTGIQEDDPKLAAEQITTLKNGLERNEVIRDMLLSPDKKATFIISDFDDTVKEHYLSWILEVKNILNEARKDERINIYVAGEPYFLAEMLVEVRSHWFLFLISIIFVFLILYFESRILRAALLPLVGVGISITWTLGLMGFTEYKLTTMMILTPVLIFAVGIGHSVQVMRRYLEEFRLTKDHQLAAEEAIAQNIVPAMLAIITDVAGFLALSTVDISFYQAYALFGQIGMFSLLLTCTTLVPVMITVLPPPKLPKRRNWLQQWESNMGGFLTGVVTGPKKWIPIAIVALLLGVSASYFPDIERGINYPEAAFKKDSTIITDLNQLNRLMPGVISFNIPFLGVEAGALTNVEVLKGIARMEDTLRADPNIGFTSSFAQYIRLLNKHMHNNKEEFWTIPDDPDLVEQYIFIYSLGADPEDFDMVVDYDYTNGQLIGYINTLEPSEVQRVVAKIQSYIELHSGDKAFDKVNIGLRISGNHRPGVGGFAGTTEATREVSEAEWLHSPLLTALMVAIITAILFRSITMSILIMTMVIMTLWVQYGMAGYFSSVGNWGGNLHFGNLVALSIAMGLGVDYSIYLASRFKVEYNVSEDLMGSMSNTLSSSGSAVVLSVVALLFSLIPMISTDIANTWGLGMYVGVAIIVSVFTAMTILPILIKLTIDLPISVPKYSNLLNLQVSERTLALRKEKQQLSEALRMLRETQSQLVESEKMASLGGLVAGVAHEINTPLGNALTVSSHLDDQVKMIADLYAVNKMKRSSLESFFDTAKEACAMLTTNLHRAANLVQSFKQVAVDQTSEEKRRFGVKTYVEEILLSLRPKLKRTKIVVEQECPEDLSLDSFPGAFSQVLSNLIINALTHAFEQDDEGILRIEVGYEGDLVNKAYPFPETTTHTKLIEGEEEAKVYLRFSDNGKGIPQENLGKIFDPFFTTRRGAGGSGLGLHIVYNIVTQTLNGDISCHSELGKGTEFMIKFPVDAQK